MGARFSAHVQTGPGAHTAYCAVVTGALHGVKLGVDHPTPSRAEGNEKVDL